MYVVPHRTCRHCRVTKPDYAMISKFMCADCFDIRARRNKRRSTVRLQARRRAAGWVPRYRRWTRVELFKLRLACLMKFTYDQAGVWIGRSPKGCRFKMKAVCWTGLRNVRKGYHSPRKWTLQRLKPVWEAAALYGPREAARVLDLSPNIVAGVLHRYPPPD
jgi:hypothetical protein